MDAAAKGERYARIFRKAGALIGKGDIARAIGALKEGVALAEANGDRTMVLRFNAEIERIQKPAEPSG